MAQPDHKTVIHHQLEINNTDDFKYLSTLFNQAILQKESLVEFHGYAYSLSAAAKALRQYQRILVKQARYTGTIKNLYEKIKRSVEETIERIAKEHSKKSLQEDAEALDDTTEPPDQPSSSDSDFQPRQPIIDPLSEGTPPPPPPASQASQVKPLLEAQRRFIELETQKVQLRTYLEARVLAEFDHSLKSLAPATRRTLLADPNRQAYLRVLIDQHLNSPIRDPDSMAQNIFSALKDYNEFGLRQLANATADDQIRSLRQSIKKDLENPPPGDEKAQLAALVIKDLKAKDNNPHQSNYTLARQEAILAANQDLNQALKQVESLLNQNQPAAALAQITSLEEISLSAGPAGPLLQNLKNTYQNSQSIPETLATLKQLEQAYAHQPYSRNLIRNLIDETQQNRLSAESLDQLEHNLIHQSPLGNAAHQLKQSLESAASPGVLTKQMAELNRVAAHQVVHQQLTGYLSGTANPAIAAADAQVFLDGLNSSLLAGADPTNPAALTNLVNLDALPLSPEGRLALSLDLPGTIKASLSALGQDQQAYYQSLLNRPVIPQSNYNPSNAGLIYRLSRYQGGPDNLVKLTGPTASASPTVSSQSFDHYWRNLNPSVKNSIDKKVLFAALSQDNSQATFGLLHQLNAALEAGQITPNDITDLLSRNPGQSQNFVQEIIRGDRQNSFLSPQSRTILRNAFPQIPRPQPSFRFLSFLRDPVSAFRSWLFPGGPGGTGGAAASRGFRLPMLGGQTGSTLFRRLGGKLAGFGSSLLRGGSGLLGKIGSGALSTGIKALGGLATGALGGIAAWAGVAVVASLGIVFLLMFLKSPQETAQIIGVGQGGGGEQYIYCDPATDPTCPAAFCNPELGDCRWPLQCGCITQLDYTSANDSHYQTNALDFGVSGCGQDVGVYAMHDGTITRLNNTLSDGTRGKALGYGNFIEITSPDGAYRTIYAHLSQGSPEGITLNATVEKNQLIGLADNTGWSTGPHLHFEYLGGPNIKTILPDDRPIVNELCI